MSAATARPGSARPSSRREDILREAARLFATHGFHGVSIEQLGAAVGISGPGIYRHFPSKSAILAAMLVGISERLHADGAAAVRTSRTPHDALERLITLHIAFALDEPYLITVQDRDLANLPRPDDHRVRRLQRAYVEIWASVLRQIDCRLGVAESRARAHALFGLLNSTPHSATEVDRETMAGILRDMSLRAARGDDR
ncbi:TetR/AcrR family transcriptional regulator [Frankia sp. Cas3]|uniref:TetR/AcrR family transcriptional regulator n=1 Tax=Frankia sp. Cas3 TaxID=3073926 RepID=UPI002AD35642|nr:TetR/AcrR family transcriptional regulator [Frankia sp. Cas3]